MSAPGLSMSFGTLPQPVPASAPPASDSPSVLVMVALVRQGSFANWQPIAAGLDRAQLEVAFGQWLLHNAQTYGGQFRIGPVPFLLPPETKA